MRTGRPKVPVSLSEEEDEQLKSIWGAPLWLDRRGLEGSAGYSRFLYLSAGCSKFTGDR